MTGRLLATCIPQRQQRRVSNFCSHAGGHSFPNSSSNGPAVLTDVLPPQGRPFETPAAACLVAASSLAGAPGGHVVERVGSDVTAIFNPLRRQPGSNTAQDISESFGSVAPQIVGSRHGNNHGASNDCEVVNPCRGFGNVCRVGA